MTKIEKVVTMALAIVGGIAGPWGAYTAYDASKFRQPFDEHDQLARSYVSQISSAESRKDAPEVRRVRLLYEAFEERWRAARQIVQAVASIESLSVSQLSTEQSQNLKELLAKASEGQNQPSLSSRTLGAAYFAVKDYESAAVQLSAASSKNGDPKALALKAATYSALATNTKDESVKADYEAVAVESYLEALKATKNATQLSGFAVANASLRATLSNNGIKLTNR